MVSPNVCQLYNKFYMLLKIMYVDWREYISIFELTLSELVFSTSLAISLFTPNKALSSFETLMPAGVSHYAHLLRKSFQCIFVSVVNTNLPQLSLPGASHSGLPSSMSPRASEPTIPQDLGPHTGYSPARVCPVPVILALTVDCLLLFAPFHPF